MRWLVVRVDIFLAQLLYPPGVSHLPPRASCTPRFPPSSHYKSLSLPTSPPVLSQSNLYYTHHLPLLPFHAPDLLSILYRLQSSPRTYHRRPPTRQTPPRHHRLYHIHRFQRRAYWDCCWVDCLSFVRLIPPLSHPSHPVPLVCCMGE